MAAKSRNRPGFVDAPPRRRRNPISLIPLVDVVLILLVFFMLASSFAEWRSIRIVGGGGGGEGAVNPMLGAVLVDIRKGRIVLSGQPVNTKQLAAAAQIYVARKADQLFVVRPAPGIALQMTVDVMDLLSAAGASRISLGRIGGS